MFLSWKQLSCFSLCFCKFCEIIDSFVFDVSRENFGVIGLVLSSLFFHKRIWYNFTTSVVFRICVINPLTCFVLLKHVVSKIWSELVRLDFTRGSLVSDIRSIVVWLHGVLVAIGWTGSFVWLPELPKMWGVYRSFFKWRNELFLTLNRVIISFLGCVVIHWFVTSGHGWLYLGSLFLINFQCFIEPRNPRLSLNSKVLKTTCFLLRMFRGLKFWRICHTRSQPRVFQGHFF